MIELCFDKYNELLTDRPDDSYKGSFGTLGIVAGSRCYQGAAYFATLAALRTGVGIAVSFIPDVIYDAFASKINGAVIESMASADGCICDKTLISRLNSRRVDTVLCGSGLGFNDVTYNTVCDVLSSQFPVVLDGDGISVITRDITRLKRKLSTVITPHYGEFARITGKSIRNIKANAGQYAAEFAVKYNCITVLKGSSTVISDTDGTLYSLSRPCSALAKGGSGDVLAGFVASFMAQGMSAIDSAVAAVTLHNSCGYAAAQKYGARFCQPDDFIEMIPTLKVR